MVAAAGNNDISYKVGADASGAVAEFGRAASSLEGLQQATGKDFSSGLVRSLERLENQAKLMSKQITQADLDVQRFQKAGASEEMINRFKAAQANVERIAKSQADAAEKLKNDEARLKQVREENIRHNQQQQEQIDAYKAAQARRDEENVKRQLQLYADAEKVKESLYTKEQRYQMELLRLQEMRNAGLINEAQLQAAAGNARSAINASRGPGGGGRGGFVTQQLAFGAQDAVTGYQVNGWQGAMMSGSNNVIQAASLANPAFGSVAALVVLGAQLAMTFAKSKDEAAKLKNEVDSVKRATDLWGKSSQERAEAAGEEGVAIARQQQIEQRAYQELAKAESLKAHLEEVRQKEVADYLKKAAASGNQGPFVIPATAASQELERTQERITALTEVQAKAQKEILAAKTAQSLANGRSEIVERAMAEAVIQRAALETKNREWENNWRRAEGMPTLQEEQFVSRGREMADQLRLIRGEATELTLELERMKEAGASPEFIADFKRLAEEVETARNRADFRKSFLDGMVERGQSMGAQLQQLAQEAKAIQDQFRTPDKVMQDEADRLLKMEAVGALSREDAQKQLARTQMGLMGASGLSSALSFGSAEELSARNNLNAQSEQQMMAKNLAESTLATRENTQALRDFKDQMGSVNWEDVGFLGMQVVQ